MAVVVAFVLLIAAASASAGKIECEAAPSLGICNNIFHRYFFNTTSEKCQSYYYGGCGASPNNFQSYKECKDTCQPGTPYSTFDCLVHGFCFDDYKLSAPAAERLSLCAQKAETGMCRAYIPSFYYNAESGKCESFIYGGCGGNDNRFESIEKCHSTCSAAAAAPVVDKQVLCTQESKTGLCMAYIPSFFYNAKSGECESFVYGGCGGNDNRFQTKEDCHATCAGVQEKKAHNNPEVLCAQKSETGMCRAYFPSFYFNAESGKCESFIYGGCGGNDNRFDNIEDCHATCGAVSYKKRDVKTVLCAQKAETGMCRAYVPSFFYNAESGKCESFVYGGCGGNENRFSTEEECHATCGAEEETPVFNINFCFQEVKAGPCFNALPRFHFNRRTGTCEKFVYGGCQGNQNNFETQHDCENHCLVA